MTSTPTQDRLLPLGMDTKHVALEKSAKEFLSSPQGLIRSFLNHAIPDFPDLSMVGDPLGSSTFTNDLDVKDILNNLEGHPGAGFGDGSHGLSLSGSPTSSASAASASSSSASSIELSLPDSFNHFVPVGATRPTQPIQLETAGLEWKAQVQLIMSNLPRAHCPRCQEIVQSTEQQLSHMLQVQSTAVATAKLQEETAVKSQKAVLSECNTLQARCSRLSMLLDQETSARTDAESRAALLRECEKDKQRIERELQDLQRLFDQQSSTLSALQNSLSQQQSTAHDAQRVKDLLAMDKAHLANELSAVQVQVARQAEQILAERQRCVALEEQVASLTTQLVTAHSQHRATWDEKVDKEVQRVRQEMIKEMEALKATSKEISERESRALLESKMSLDAECQDLRRRNELLSGQLVQHQSELLASQQAHTTEASELRAQLKIKTFELASLGTTLEQRCAQLRQTELELVSAQEEVRAHTLALLRMEAEKDAAMAGLQTSLQQCRARLEAYEALEVEVDEAVMRCAHQHQLANGSSSPSVTGAGGGEGAVQQAESPLGHNAAVLADGGAVSSLFSFRNLPTHPQRRLQQAISLAQRLFEAEKQRDDLQRQLQLQQAKASDLEGQVEEWKRAVQRSSQPTSYLVNNLREQEHGRAQAEKQAKELQEQLMGLQRREQQWRQESLALRERLGCVLQQRGELQTVKEMLQHLHEMEIAEEEEDDDDGDDDDDEGDNDEEEEKPATNRGNRAWQVMRPDLSKPSHEGYQSRTPSGGVGKDQGGDERLSLASDEPSFSHALVDAAVSPMNKPRTALSLQARAARLGVSADMLMQMLTPPAAFQDSGRERLTIGPGESSAPPASSTMPGIAIKSYRRRNA